MKKIVLFIFSYILFVSLLVNAQGKSNNEGGTTRILFVFDASQSMYGRWQSDMKISIAQRLMSDMLDSLKETENVELGLRVYGHTKNYPPQDCDDTKLEVPIAAGNIEIIKQRLKSLIPSGTTPIAYALEQAQYDFPSCENCRNIIILITDGIEECDGDPCAVSQALQRKGIALKPFVIGIGRDFRDEFDCVGTYFDATSEESFRQALKVVISQALNSTTAQVNLLDLNNNPTETSVNMTFYDNFSEKMVYNFIHTFNHKGLPDTLVIDPLMHYDIVVHTIPPKSVENVKLTPGKHTIIPIAAPQGSLHLKVQSNAKLLRGLQCIVRQDNKMETINVQSFNTSEKYIVGKYDLEVLSLPRLKINDVEILQSHTTTIEIPQPGIATITLPASGYGSIFLENKNKLEWVYNMETDVTQESIILLPGKYRLVYIPKNQKKSQMTIEKTFEIKSGISEQIKLY